MEKKINITRSYWLLRPMPHGSNHMQDFLEQDIVAVGYPSGISFAKMDYDSIKDVLEKHNYEQGIGNVNTLVHLMKEEDIIVVPDDNNRDVYLAKVISGYIYDAKLDKDEKGSGYPHQRKVEWFLDKKPLLRSNFPEELKGSLRYPGTVASLDKHAESISDILSLDFEDKSEVVSIKEEAKQALRELLKSDNEECKLRAAEIIIRDM